MMRQIFPWAVLLVWWTTVSGDEPAVRFQSATPRTALLELYTSEGCSSCPPAEKWLSRQVGSPQLWREFVPVAFHVDYWNDLGWRDPWSKAEFSARQRQYRAKWRSKTIYTPQFVVEGKEWRGWQGRDIPRNTTPIGILNASSADTNLWSIRFNPSNSDQADIQAHAVWLIGNVISAVQTGENEGRTLRHDFIAISLVTAPMQRQSDGWECKLNLTPPAGARSGRDAVAVAFWITKAGQLDSLQATGGWLKHPQ